VLAGGDKTLSLGVIVPGGQQVYVAPDGALSYTQAHSAYIPPGSVVDQFSKTAPSGGQSFGYLNFETGFVACPAADATQGYQVFGQVDGATFGPDCLGFSALTCKYSCPILSCMEQLANLIQLLSMLLVHGNTKKGQSPFQQTSNNVNVICEAY
jgi:hypothetical protein